MIKQTLTVLCVCVIATIQIQAQDFDYTPRNPAFGGNPYNYSWLLSSAQAQDTYKAPEKSSTSTGRTASNPVDDFAESLNRQILSQLSRQLVANQFGEGGLEEGTYLLGDYQIEIGNSGSGIVISIVDVTTGTTTTVAVPFF